MNKKINVIGLGYIGLPTAALFAYNGLDVVGVDKLEKVVNLINDGMIHIEEPGLASLVKNVVKKGKLKASLLPTEADVFIIAVPTPNDENNNKGCDIQFLLNAINSIITYLKKGNVIIIESTISPRTTENKIKPVLEQAGYTIGKDIYLAHCPERVMPGQIIEELVNNDRIVGGITPQCSEEASKIYEIFVKGKIIKTEAKTAEMSKLMENTYRDINIAVANELTKICVKLNINVLDVIEMANMHPRVNILKPGPGVGGHCLAVDPYFIYAESPKTAQLIKKARDVNNMMPEYVVSLVEKLLKNNKNKIVTIFGVTYKADVDDLRESPSLKIAEILIKKGYKIKIHDPLVNNNEFYSEDDALKNSDLLLCLVGHNQFKNLDMKKLDKLMNTKIILDIANIFNSKENFIFNYGNIYKLL